MDKAKLGLKRAELIASLEKEFEQLSLPLGPNLPNKILLRPDEVASSFQSNAGPFILGWAARTQECEVACHRDTGAKWMDSLFGHRWYQAYL